MVNRSLFFQLKNWLSIRAESNNATAQYIPLNRIFVLYVLFSFLFLTIKPAYCQEPAQTSMEQHIASLIAGIEQNNRIVGELTAESLANLPVGIKKTVGGNRYIIGIDSARFTEKGIYLSAYTEVTLHKDRKKIAFAARNVPPLSDIYSTVERSFAFPHEVKTRRLV